MTTATITVIDRSTVKRILEEHEACERADREWVSHAIECGRLLAEVKAQLRHGEWGPWLADNFPASMRTAQTYMQLAAAPEEKRNAVAGLPLREARDEIATPRAQSPAQSTDQLRHLGGGRSPELERRLAEAREQREQAELWSEQERRKLARARDQLEDVLSRLDDAANTSSLSRESIGRLVREQAVTARQAASALDDLAFSFER